MRVGFGMDRIIGVFRRQLLGRFADAAGCIISYMQKALYDPTFLGIVLVGSLILAIAMLGFQLWVRERRTAERRRHEQQLRDDALREEQQRRDDEWRKVQHEMEQRRIALEERREEKRHEEAEMARWEARRMEEDKLAAGNAGAGSGGYIVVEMSEKERPLFHDLLKGFEDYAKLKGYHIAFSIDSSRNEKIAFKFTIKDDGLGVGAERVRQDFKDYVEQVRDRDIDELDDMPVIASIDEHNLLVTLLKNRISFLKHSYQLSQNAVNYYQSVISNVRTFPVLPAPTNVVVHTGGNMDSRSYSALNSPKAIQGDHNLLSDSSVNIGDSFNERQKRIAALDGVVDSLEGSADKTEEITRAMRSLSKVRDELAEEPQPNPSMLRKWLEAAKELLSGAALGVDAAEAAKKLWEMFGL